MSKTYFLSAGIGKSRSNNPLVEYVADRFIKKQNIWQQRDQKLASLHEKVRFLLSVYVENQGSVPKSPKQRQLFYKSLLAHQAMNILMGTKLQPDFMSYRPLGIEHNRKIVEAASATTRAHRVIRQAGRFPAAQRAAKKDLIWGNSFMEMCLEFNKDDSIKNLTYEHVPFYEMRNFYGQGDRIRVTNYTINDYAEQFGEEELEDVAEGGILNTLDENTISEPEKKQFVGDGIIQVVRLTDANRKIWAEIHGGNGKIKTDLEGDKFPLVDGNGKGFDPYLESRFYEDPSSNFFGYGVMDFLIDLAGLDTTVSNAVIGDVLWDASAPTFISTGDKDAMKADLRKWERDRARGRNRVIINKDNGLGGGKVTQLQRGARTDLLGQTDDFVISRGTRGSNIDFNSMAEYAPTAEQQKLKKLEADKLNLRVLLLNEQEQIDFATKELYFIQNNKTEIHNFEIEVDDEVADKYQSPNGYKPMLKKKIGDILDGVKDVQLQISPRMEGALDDMTFFEIQDMMDSVGMIPDGTQAKVIALEKLFSKKNPEMNLTREDFTTPASVPPTNGGDGAPTDLTETAATQANLIKP